MFGLIVAFVSGCRDGGPEPVVYSITLADDSTQVYGPVPPCTGVYCMTWTPSTRTTDGILHVEAGQAVFRTDGSEWRGSWPGADAHLHSDMTVELGNENHCELLRMTFVSPSSGTFRRWFDCHGLESAGRLMVR